MNEWPFKKYTLAWIITLAIAIALIYQDMCSNTVPIIMCLIVLLSIFVLLGECNGSDFIFDDYMFIMTIFAIVSVVVVLPLSMYMFLILLLIVFTAVYFNCAFDNVSPYPVLFTIVILSVMAYTLESDIGSNIVGLVLSVIIILYSIYVNNENMSIIAIPVYCIPHLVSSII